MWLSTGRGASAHFQPARLAVNAFLNLGGHAVPLVAGILAIPLLISGLGTSRFGVLTLAWLAVGYFSLFDLGLGRALTKVVAERTGTAEEGDIASLAWTALAMMCGFAVLGSVTGMLLAPWLVDDVLRIPVDMKGDAEDAMRLLALSLPVVITSVGLRSLLEAQHRFGWVNVIRIFTGVFTFCGPLLILPFSSSLTAIVAILFVGRVIGWCAHLAICFRAMPWLFRSPQVELRFTRILLGLGGWITVSNIVGPVMVYMDRFLIASVISAAAVAYYATPYEVLTKMWLVPGALLGVLFPAFSAGLRHDPAWVGRTFRRAVEILLLILFPATLLVVLFAHEGLTMWLGPEFASQSVTVAKWLAIGIFINSVAQVPFTLLQGGGRADLTAKLHVAELPPYVAGLWWLTTRYGIQGAAAMWTVRATVDALLLFLLVPRVLTGGFRVVRNAFAAAAAALAALAVAALTLPGSLKLGYFLIVLVGSAVLARKAVRLGIQQTASVNTRTSES